MRKAEPKVTKPIATPKTLNLSETKNTMKKSISDNNKVINMTTVVLNKMELKKIPKSGSTGFKVPMTETFLDYKKSSKHTEDSKSSNPQKNLVSLIRCINVKVIKYLIII